MKKVSGGPKQIACLQLDHAHTRTSKYVTNLGEKKVTSLQAGLRNKTLK